MWLTGPIVETAMEETPEACGVCPWARRPRWVRASLPSHSLTRWKFHEFNINRTNNYLSIEARNKAFNAQLLGNATFWRSTLCGMLRTLDPPEEGRSAEVYSGSPIRFCVKNVIKHTLYCWFIFLCCGVMATENLDDCTGGLSSEYVESPEINQCSCLGSRQRNGILDCAETPGESHGWPYAFKTLACSIWSLTVSLSLPLVGRERNAPDCDECIQRRKWKQEQSCFRGLRIRGRDCSLSIHFVARHWLLFVVHYCLHEWISINDSKYLGQFMISDHPSHTELWWFCFVLWPHSSSHMKTVG